MEADIYQVHDLISGTRYTWRGRRNYVELDPEIQPAHIFESVLGRRRSICLATKRVIERFLKVCRIFASVAVPPIITGLLA